VLIIGERLDMVVCIIYDAATKYDRYKTVKDFMWQLSQWKQNLQENDHKVIRYQKHYY
jgi:hypothetical protein